MNQKNGITYRKLPGMSGQGLRIWGLLFLAFGCAYAPNLAAYFHSEETGFLVTTAGLVLQLLHYCAIPIFAFLLVEGFTHTVSAKDYAIRVGILAVAAELPYHFAYGKNPFDFTASDNLLGALSFNGGLHFDYAEFSLNPVFGLLLSMILLYFFKRYAGKNIKHVLLKAVLWLMAFVWTEMLHIENGKALVLLVPILYFLRNKRMWVVFAGCIAMTLCGFLDSSAEAGFLQTAAYIGCAPIAFIMIHFYNGEPGEGNRYVNYFAYPVILIAIGLVANFAIK